MRPFEYQRAGSLGEAAHAATGAEAAIIAGGTNLLDLMKLQVETPTRLVDITRLDLSEIAGTDEGGLRIGALVTNADCAADERVRRDYAVLSRAILAGATGQLRNKATTGGNLMQRTRCYYFQDPTARCNKREPGSGCDAMEGLNRIHAIHGFSEQCIATHPSDMAVGMLALGARVEVEGPRGKRGIALEDFHRLPRDTPHIETNLEPGEIITAVTLPAPVPGSHQAYRKARDRSSYAFALASVAIVATMTDGAFDHVAFAFGGIAPTPWRDHDVEEMLKGEAPSPALFERAADALMDGAKGHGHNDFKVPLMRRLFTAALNDAARAGNDTARKARENA